MASEPKPSTIDQHILQSNLQILEAFNERDTKRRHSNRKRRRKRRTGETSHDHARRRLLRSHDPTIRDRRRETIRIPGETCELGRLSPSSSSIRRNPLDRPHHKERQQKSPMDPNPMRSIRQTTRPQDERVLREDRTETWTKQSRHRRRP